jgi:hypothetical protein
MRNKAPEINSDSTSTLPTSLRNQLAIPDIPHFKKKIDFSVHLYTLLQKKRRKTNPYSAQYYLDASPYGSTSLEMV